jgi:hypothetical protein
LNRLRQQLGLDDQEAVAFEQELGGPDVAIGVRSTT